MSKAESSAQCEANGCKHKPEYRVGWCYVCRDHLADFVDQAQASQIVDYRFTSPANIDVRWTARRFEQEKVKHLEALKKETAKIKEMQKTPMTEAVLIGAGLLKKDG